MMFLDLNKTSVYFWFSCFHVASWVAPPSPHHTALWENSMQWRQSEDGAVWVLFWKFLVCVSLCGLTILCVCLTLGVCLDVLLRRVCVGVYGDRVHEEERLLPAPHQRELSVQEAAEAHIRLVPIYYCLVLRGGHEQCQVCFSSHTVTTCSFNLTCTPDRLSASPKLSILSNSLFQPIIHSANRTVWK